MDADLKGGIVVGKAVDLISGTREEGAAPFVEKSDGPRGLALRSLTVTRGWEGLWGLLNRRKKIYFLTVALDLSGAAPVVMPPKEVPDGAVLEVEQGETIHFTLGDGAPIFAPRVISGGLIVYILIAEADRGIRHVGQVLEQIHSDLSKDKTISEVIKKLVADPGKAAADIALSAITAALQPIATILKANQDDYVALFQGCFEARGPWDENLRGALNGVTIELKELDGK
jgi:hypothetical protein